MMMMMMMMVMMMMMMRGVTHNVICQQDNVCNTVYDNKCETVYDTVQVRTSYKHLNLKLLWRHINHNAYYVLKTRRQEEKCESKYDTKCETQYATEYEEVRTKLFLSHLPSTFQVCRTETRTEVKTEYDNK